MYVSIYKKREREKNAKALSDPKLILINTNDVVI